MPLSSDELDQRLDFALRASSLGAEVILQHYQSQGLDVERKHDDSPVTIADREAERLLRDEITRHFPDDAIVGEEFGESEGTSGSRWILDPIDGTKAFIAGVPLFGVMIGLEHEGECVLGTVRFPVLGEAVAARRGGGTWYHRSGHPPRQTFARDTSELASADLCITDIECWREVSCLDGLLALSAQCRITRGWGDCYGHCLIATGRADIMVDPMLNSWDAAALIPIVTESGAEFVDFRGRSTIHGGNGISVVPRLKTAVLEILQAGEGDAR